MSKSPTQKDKDKDRVSVDVRDLRDRVDAVSDLPELADRSFAARLKLLILKGLETFESKLAEHRKDPKNWDARRVSEAAAIPIERIRAIQQGDRVIPDELIGLSRALQVDCSELHHLLKREGKKNGCS